MERNENRTPREGRPVEVRRVCRDQRSLLTTQIVGIRVVIAVRLPAGQSTKPDAVVKSTPPAIEALTMLSVDVRICRVFAWVSLALLKLNAALDWGLM